MASRTRRSRTEPAAAPAGAPPPPPPGARPLPRAFYARPARTVARALLGRTLVRDGPGGRVAGVIVEVEAYRGALDPASHAYRGPTPRNRTMFGPPGHAYVYFTYGMHHCVNVVCEEEGRAAAVLLRALAPCAGLATMAARRDGAPWARLAQGPGRLARALALTRADDGADLVRGRLWLADLPPRRGGRPIARGPRIGISAARERPWRFWLAGHPCVSPPRGAPGPRRRPARGAQPAARARVRR